MLPLLYAVTHVAHMISSPTDLPPEERAAFEGLQALAEEKENWKEVPEEILDQMKLCLMEHRDFKLKGSRSTTKSLLSDVRATGNRIEEEVSIDDPFINLYLRFFPPGRSPQLPMFYFLPFLPCSG